MRNYEKYEFYHVFIPDVQAVKSSQLEEGLTRALLIHQATKCCENCGSGKIEYRGLGQYKCHACNTYFFSDYGKVRNYIDENGISRIDVISQETGVDVSRIQKMVEMRDFTVVAGRLY